MQLFQNWVSIIVVFAGAGALIDFALGKKGQKLVQDRLETWWIQLADVRAKSFGRDEARMAAQFLDLVFGGFFSFRRLLSILALVICGALYWLMFRDQNHSPFDLGLASASGIGVDAIFASISISLTQTVSWLASRFAPNGTVKNILLYASVLFVQAVILIFGIQLVHRLSLGIAILQWGSLPLSDSLSIIFRGFGDQIRLAFIDPIGPIINANKLADGISSSFQLNVSAFLEYFPTLLRTLLAILFLASWLIKPMQAMVLGFIARLLESGKPVFTIVLGGLGAIIKGAQEISTKLP